MGEEFEREAGIRESFGRLVGERVWRVSVSVMAMATDTGGRALAEM